MATYAHHRLDIYGTELYVTKTKRGWANIRRHVPSIHELDVLGGGQTSESFFEPRDGAHSEHHVAVYVNPNDGELQQIDTIAHEATHVAQLIFEAAGSPFEGEPAAYLVGWLTAWLFARLREIT